MSLIQTGRLVCYGGNHSDHASEAVAHHDSVEAQWDGRGVTYVSAEERVHELSARAEDLAGRLADSGLTGSISQLSDAATEYAHVVEELEEAQRTWIHAVRHAIRSFSD
ncbi:MAG: hypothetical protein ACR2JC_13455 [Chloroflexota bacterium]